MHTFSMCSIYIYFLLYGPSMYTFCKMVHQCILFNIWYIYVYFLLYGPSIYVYFLLYGPSMYTFCYMVSCSIVVVRPERYYPTQLSICLQRNHSKEQKKTVSYPHEIINSVNPLFLRYSEITFFLLFIDEKLILLCRKFIYI